MQRTLIAIIVTALVSGALMTIEMLALDAWHSRLYIEAHAPQPSSPGADTVQVENPYELVDYSVSSYVGPFIACCAGSTFWAVFVVIPSLLASRRVFPGALASNIVAAVVVSTASGIMFTSMQGSHYIPPLIPFAAGSVFGLLSLVLLVKMLPSTTSPERTRDP